MLRLIKVFFSLKQGTLSPIYSGPVTSLAITFLTKLQRRLSIHLTNNFSFNLTRFKSRYFILLLNTNIFLIIFTTHGFWTRKKFSIKFQNCENMISTKNCLTFTSVVTIIDWNRSLIGWGLNWRWWIMIFHNW